MRLLVVLFAITVGELRAELDKYDIALPVRVSGLDGVEHELVVQNKISHLVLAPAESVIGPDDNTALRFFTGVGIYPHGDVQRVGSGQRWLTDAEIKDPDVQFILHRVRWKYLEPQKDNYQLQVAQQQIRRYRAANKPYGFMVMTGTDCSPLWLAPNQLYKGRIPPWAQSLAPEYAQLCKVLADMQVQRVGEPVLRMADDKLFSCWMPTGPTVDSSQELHPGIVTQIPGYSVDKMRTAWRASLVAGKQYYPNVMHPLALSLQGAAAQYTPLVVQDAENILGKQAAYQHNALNYRKTGAKYDLENYKVHNWLKQLQQQGKRVGFEAVGAALNQTDRMGGPDPMQAINGPGAFGSYFIMYPPDVPKLRAIR